MGEVFRGPGNLFDCGVNMEEELYANSDGRVYPIVKWTGADAEDCAKEEAAFAIAGEGNRWFCVHLGEFGIGPLQDRYPLIKEDSHAR